MEANDNMTSNARRIRESRARLTYEQQQQYLERDAELHRTACAGFSVDQLQLHREQNTDQKRAARSGFGEEPLGEIRLQDATQHKAVWDALTQEQREHKLQQQRMRRKVNYRNAARTQDSLVNDYG